MGKLLVLVILGFIAYALWRSMLAKAARAAREAERDKGGERARTVGGELMVKCRRCGVNLPVGEAILVRGEHYCSTEHVEPPK